MIVGEIMTTELITVTPDDTLSHAANLLRQYQFHHLPVVHAVSTHGTQEAEPGTKNALLELKGLLTSHDIDLAVALGTWSSSDVLQLPWQERRVVEVMHRAAIRVAPTTSVAAAAQMLVERGLNCLPVVEYKRLEQDGQENQNETRAILLGLVTRSDLLMALARSLGAFEPGMQLLLPLPNGNLAPLGQMLQLAGELHIQVRSVVAAPLEGSVPRVATVRIGTINPAPLLVRLREANIEYMFADSEAEGDVHV